MKLGNKIVMIAGILSCGILAIFTFTIWRNHDMQKKIASEILRFHVLANSDSSEDQEEKMQVKQAVAEYLHPILAQADSKETAMDCLQKHLYNIEEIAQKIVDSRNIEEPTQEIATSMKKEKTTQKNIVCRKVEVSLKEDWFPAITYGDCTFPAGIYDTLCIRIGESKGHNWWCVLYPGLCFSSAVQPAVTEGDKMLLKYVLDEECYNFLLRPAKTKLRFRLFGLELFKENS